MLFLRVAPVLLAVLAVVYVCAFYYMRDTYRDSLSTGPERIHPEILETRVQTYSARIARRLAWIVFAAPLGTIALAILIVDLI